MEQSILDEVRSFDWDDAAMVRFEVTLELIGQVMAEYTTRIGEAEAATPPDRAAARRWRGERSRAARDRRGLRASDSTEVGRVLQQYTLELQHLRTSREAS